MNNYLKRLYYSKKISASRGNVKESWKTINELRGKRSKSSDIDCLIEQNTETTSKEEISNIMNSFFCSVGKDLACKIDPTPNPLISGDYNVNKEKVKFEFRSIKVWEIREAFANAKSSKSFGFDGISSYFMKIALPFIENSLALLFNTSIETSKFPVLWKIARVTPIYKEGERTDKSNYRPISVLPVISRLFEKLISNQLHQHMGKNYLFSNKQSGFLQLRSTVTCLLKNTNDWYNGLDVGKLVGLVFIDLKKAFDTVDHSILCKKLHHYSIRDRELDWFRSYLTARKQFSRVNGVDSKIRNIEVGVPQGSCLGPLLFLVYINDLPQAIKASTVSMYADDTSLCYQSRDINQLNEAMNSDLRHLELWLQGNRLSLNVAKTHSMLVTTKSKHSTLKQQNAHLELKISEHDIQVVQQKRYLGVEIDCSLDWKKQIEAISKKVSKALGFLKHAKSFLSVDVQKILYSGIMEPHLRYCCSVWGCAGLSNLNQLQKLQNRAARLITNSSFDAPSLPLIQGLGWKSIKDIIETDTKLMVFKSLNGLAPQYLSDLFTKNLQIAPYNLRNTVTDLRLPKKTTMGGQKAFSYRGAKLWNSLSAEPKQAPSLSYFKKVV